MNLPRYPGNVLVTGGASGLGAATVAAVREAGGLPLVIDRAPPAEPVRHVLADVSETGAAEAAVGELAEQAGGRIDAVFTAAGVDACGALDAVPAKDWERVVQVNLLGTAAVVRAALPFLRRSRGTVVTCASTLGLRAVGDATAYCAAKHGVVGFTRALAAETAGEVGVTMLVPGGMDTHFFDDREEQYRPPADAELNQPGHVARTVLFALGQPPGSEVRELVVCCSREGSWP
ncbi:SDR family oxidoreductase [Amycolatopsis aidingensis]|uniref:SDR family oxidoreductase n=1 Tax=Amycolatopsis aidingensis TaxID=2842453 RepID=UPI001C0C76EF|nr:SDR family oxidoreductase [Amycolatopsis aidingensis]